MIGKAVIRHLNRNRLDVLVYDPFLSNEKAEELDTKKANLREIFFLYGNKQSRGESARNGGNV